MQINKHFTILLLCCAMAPFVSGCATWTTTKEYAKGSWEKTKDILDPAPTIDTDNYEFENPNQRKLAELFAPVDGPLTSLVRFVDDRDTLPEVDWMDLLQARFPWVNRVIVTDADGTIILMQPMDPVKRIETPLVFKGVWREMSLMTVVDYSDLGPELYIGRPYFKDIDFKGLIAVGFDPRAILNLSPRPKELILIHPGSGIWSRGADVDTDAVMAVPWLEILKREVQGQVKVGDKHYTWLVRYVGDDRYIYATESVDPDADGESWWSF